MISLGSHLKSSESCPAVPLRRLYLCPMINVLDRLALISHMVKSLNCLQTHPLPTALSKLCVCWTKNHGSPVIMAAIRQSDIYCCVPARWGLQQTHPGLLAATIHVKHLTWLYSHNYLYKKKIKRNEPHIWFAFFYKFRVSLARHNIVLEFERFYWTH